MNEKQISEVLSEVIRYCNEQGQWLSVEPGHYLPAGSIFCRHRKDCPGCTVFTASGLAHEIFDLALARSHQNLLKHVDCEVDGETMSEDFGCSVFRSRQLLNDPPADNRKHHKALLDAVKEHFGDDHIAEALSVAIGTSDYCLNSGS